MKRRNADCGKIRRPIKRNKITEGMYGSTTVLYLKFLILWAIVITADFMFMFRFEFLWPFWLLLRSVHESFKYKGLAFSVLFVCIAITSDLVCLFFIPVHWLLFAASTYVWVQYVWHTDKGICLPTIILWMLFVYLEAGIRWKDSRHMPHLDLCRPFAAHCIGYPVVTLGFGFKSYIGYRMRQRKQREVAKENEFYMQLLQQALPQDESTITSSNNAQANTDDIINQHHHQNGGILHSITSSTISSSTPSGQLISAIPVAQQVQITQNSSNSLLSSTSNQHQNHHQHQNSISSSSSSVIVDNTSSSNNYHHTMSDVQIGQTQTTTTTTAVSSSGTTISSSSTLSSTGITSSTTMSFSSQGGASNSGTSSSTSYLTNNLSNLNNYSSNKASTSGVAQTANNKLNNNLSNLISSNAANIQGSTMTATSSNGHVSSGNYNSNSNNSSNSKNNRKSLDKENKKYESNSNSKLSTHSNSNTYHEISSKDKQTTDSNWNENSTGASGMLSSSSSTPSMSNKAESKESKPHFNGGMQAAYGGNTYNNSTGGTNDKEGNVNGHSNNSGNNKTKLHQQNGNVMNFEIEEIQPVVIDPPERTKGRKSRSKRGENNSSAKDNHQNNNNSSNNNNSNSFNQNHHGTNVHHHLTKDSHGNSDTSSNTSTSSSSAVSTASSTITNFASQIVTKICDTCFRLESEVKKYRSEISHMKQIENELRQKLDSNVTTKSCLQAKQRECDELEKRLQELQTTRQCDLINIQNLERRLQEERRQRQSLEAQLNNEKKARKSAEEKATRPECGELCKQRKQQIDNEMKQLRRELKSVEESKQVAEQQSRKCEQELRMFEAEVRNREAQQGTERLISALADMQYKNSTLEKNLSAETRVKLDLFSALGEAKRQLEIKDSLIRNKDNEVLDLKAKIAQLLAIMPSDTLCLSSPCPTTGPSSPMLSLSTAHQQIMSSNLQLNSRGCPTSIVSAHNVGVVVNGNVSTATVVGGGSGAGGSGNNIGVQNVQNSGGQNTNNNAGGNQSISQSTSVTGAVTQQCTTVQCNVNSHATNTQNLNVVTSAGGNIMSSNSGQTTSSNLDPNATAYTPKNSIVSGSDA